MSIPRAMLRSTSQMRHQTRQALEIVHRETETCLNSKMKPSELLRRFDNISDALCQVIDTADFVRCVHPENTFRECASEAIQSLSECIQRLNTNQDMYEKLATMKGNMEDLNEEERRMADTLLHDFEENGIHLPDDMRERIRTIQYEIAVAGDEFFDNVNTTSRPVHTSTDVVKALPKEMRDLIYDEEEDVNTVIVPSFHPFNQSFLQNVPISMERKKMYVVLERESHSHYMLHSLNQKNSNSNTRTRTQVRSSEQHTNQRRSTRTSSV